MRPLDCAGFEAALAEALAAPGACDGETAARLGAHASACPLCRASADLVELAAHPASSRDPIPDPPPAYWARFEVELAARIEGERRRDARRRTGLAAAAVVLVAVGVGAFLRERPFRSETPRALPPVDAPAAELEDGIDPFPAAGALDGFSEDDDASLFSGADDLTPDDEERLLEWLERERRRASGGAA